MLRKRLLRLILITLSFASVSASLASYPGTALDYWYLYFSPVLICAFSFGLRGALAGSSVAMISLSILLYRFQTLLYLATQDAMLRIALLTGTPGPGLRQIIDQLSPVLSASEQTLRAAAGVDTSGDFNLTLVRVGLGMVFLTVGACLVGWQVDQQHQLLQQSHQEARTDGLTGLSNYRALMEDLGQAAAVGRAFSLLILDLDSLKAINDRYGHLVGDQGLLHIASLLRQTTRGRDIIARYGGDEFAAMLQETDTDVAQRVAQRLLRALEEHPLALPDGTPRTLHVSIGIATYPTHAYRPEDLISVADAAMYSAKQAGGQQSVVGSPLVSRLVPPGKFPADPA